MSKIFECIPNISEGRDAKVVLACVKAVSEVEGITLLNYTSDVDHNRSVITFMGEAEAIEEAAVSLAMATTKLIDLRKHSGEHPRVGALDVLPIVPLKNASEEEAVELSIKIAKRIANECGVPTYLYENSASAPHRKNLADIRRGGFEGLCEKQKDKDWLPDFGEGYHESAGVVVVGARFFLIAYNFDLKTDDLDIAKAIAKKIRQSSGGFECVKALGVMLESENKAQVTVNLTDYRKTPLWKLTEEVRRLAREYGTEVESAELIGLISMRALTESAAYYLGIRDFDSKTRVIEEFL
ncbi:MAG: glutamate formimidoyltransferase [Clostridia bacterium]|nr:glutamate formimidoyltransferase [Clostridia bacterium]